MSPWLLAVHLCCNMAAQMTDRELLDAFATRKDQSAFAELIRRHIDWIYSCARRLVRDEHLAEDVTQAVFILLATKANSIKQESHLPGWLFRSTRYCVANALKQQSRRQRHEKEAWNMHKQMSAGTDADWSAISPQLDQAVGELSSLDRDAVLMRFYQNKSSAEV